MGKKERLEPLSLAPLSVDDALRGALVTPPAGKGSKEKTPNPVEALGVIVKRSERHLDTIRRVQELAQEDPSLAIKIARHLLKSRSR